MDGTDGRHARGLRTDGLCTIAARGRTSGVSRHVLDRAPRGGVSGHVRRVAGRHRWLDERPRAGDAPAGLATTRFHPVVDTARRALHALERRFGFFLPAGLSALRHEPFFQRLQEAFNDPVVSCAQALLHRPAGRLMRGFAHAAKVSAKRVLPNAPSAGGVSAAGPDLFSSIAGCIERRPGARRCRRVGPGVPLRVRRPLRPHGARKAGGAARRAVRAWSTGRR